MLLVSSDKRVPTNLTRLGCPEVNRILGKVDELAAGDEELNTPFYVGEPVKVIDVHLTVLLVLSKK
jgi:hypothetical protein